MGIRLQIELGLAVGIVGQQAPKPATDVADQQAQVADLLWGPDDDDRPAPVVDAVNRSAAPLTPVSPALVRERAHLARASFV